VSGRDLHRARTLLRAGERPTRAALSAGGTTPERSRKGRRFEKTGIGRRRCRLIKPFLAE